MPGNSVTAVATVKPQCILTLEVAWLVHTYRYVSRSVMSDSIPQTFHYSQNSQLYLQSPRRTLLYLRSYEVFPTLSTAQG